TASAMRYSANDRSDGVVSIHSSNAVSAAFIAVSTSAAPDSGATAYCSPVVGLMTGVVLPSTASTCLPLTKFLKPFISIPLLGSCGSTDSTFGCASVWKGVTIGAMTGLRTVGVPKEIKTAEHRVAMTPDGVRELERHGINVFVETTAGEGASIADA